MRTLWIPVIVTVLLSSGYTKTFQMAEGDGPPPVTGPADLSKVPIIVEALVLADGQPVSPVKTSPQDNSLVQLWKGRVRIETVLQGQVEPGVVDIFYFRGSTSGSQHAIRFRSGDRNIFFLRRDGNKLRTHQDRSANDCILKVATGPHPNFHRPSRSSTSQALVSLLLTRGIGVTDEQMIRAMDEPRYPMFIQNQDLIRQLQRLAKVETALVREAACSSLLFLEQPCGNEQGAPTVTVQNLSSPGGGASFRFGDNIQTTIIAAPRQEIFRSSTGRVGITDDTGRFTFRERLSGLRSGTRTDVWLAGVEQVSPAVTYALRGQNGGQIITTGIGNSRDHFGAGLSALYISGDKVLTYSATSLDYQTSLYYDTLETDTLFEDRHLLRTGSTRGGASSHQVWETKVTTWRNYFILASHYAVAALRPDAFANPMSFADGSCYGIRAACQIVPLDGPVQVGNANVLLGATGGDQLAVPQDPGWALQGLDPASKLSVLDTLFTRGPQTTDENIISMIGEVIQLKEFGDDVVLTKLEELAARDTPAVRAEACRVLRKMHHPCSSTPIRSRASKPVRAPQHKAKPESAFSNPDHLRVAIPKHIVFANFLLLANEIGQDKLVPAFGLRWLKRTQLSALMSEASALTQELAKLDLKAHQITIRFRTAAQLALQGGRPIPPAPAEIHRLQAMRTAAMLNHLVNLQTRLGPEAIGNLEGTLAYEFTSGASFDYSNMVVPY